MMKMTQQRPAREPPVRALCLTLGGARRDRMARLFGGPGTGVALTFVEGVRQRDLRSRAGLLAALRAAGLLDESAGEAVETRCWRAMRHLGRDRAVLACTLAHLGAMRKCVEEGYDCIMEDNVCGPVAGGEVARRIRAAAAASPEADMRYYAYGGRSEEIEAWQRTLAGQGTKNSSDRANRADAVVWPTYRSLPCSSAADPGDKDYNILWGTMCYAITKIGYQSILCEIRADMPGALAWSPRRSKSQRAKAADKVFPKLVQRRGLKIYVATRPALVRAPLVSTIHSKYDEQFIETSRVQLACSGLSWNDVALTAEELKRAMPSRPPTAEAIANMTEKERPRSDRDKYYRKSRAHATTQGQTQGQPQTCKGCGKGFDSKNKLFKHLRDAKVKCSALDEKAAAAVPGSALTDDIPKVLRAALQEGHFSMNSPLSPWALMFDLDGIDAMVASLNDAFPENFTHCFAVKSNPVGKLLERIVAGSESDASRMGLECASFAEVVHSLRSGCPPADVVFDSPCKSRHEIRECLRFGVTVNCDNLNELERLADIWDDMCKTWEQSLVESDRPRSQVGVRINPLLGKGSIEALSVSTSDSKFGIPLTPENHRAILNAFQKYPWLNALHAHVGSQGCDLRMLAGGAVVLTKIADEIDNLVGEMRIRTIDIGGGLPTNFDNDFVTPTFQEYSQVLREEAPALFGKACAHRRILTEFGRATIAKLGWTASRIEYVKETPYKVVSDPNGGNHHVAGTKKRIAIIHAGSDMFMRTCYVPENFPLRVEAYRSDGSKLQPGPVESNRSADKPSDYALYDVAGPLCFGGDKVGRNIVLPRDLSESDFIVVRDSGANCFSTWSRHCSRRSPAVLGYSFKQTLGSVSDGKAAESGVLLPSIELLRAAESIDDVLAFW